MTAHHYYLTEGVLIMEIGWALQLGPCIIGAAEKDGGEHPQKVSLHNLFEFLLQRYAFFKEIQILFGFSQK
jgi:hypothetical protein